VLRYVLSHAHIRRNGVYVSSESVFQDQQLLTNLLGLQQLVDNITGFLNLHPDSIKSFSAMSLVCLLKFTLLYAVVLTL
jgi:hypothetical protein